MERDQCLFTLVEPPGLLTIRDPYLSAVSQLSGQVPNQGLAGGSSALPVAARGKHMQRAEDQVGGAAVQLQLKKRKRKKKEKKPHGASWL